MEGKRNVELVGEVRSCRALWALVRFCFQVHWKSTLGFCSSGSGRGSKNDIKKIAVAAA